MAKSGRRGAQIDVRALEVLDLVIRSKSVSKAALTLGVSQSAVSQTLARLRRSLADPLLARSAEGLVPTEAAVALQQEITQFLARIESIRNERVDFRPDRVKRELVLSMPEYLELLLLPPLARAVRAQAPGLSMRIQAPDPATVDGRLDRGEVDLRLGWVPTPGRLHRITPLFDDEIIVIVGARSPWARKAPTLPDLARAPHARLAANLYTTSGRMVDQFFKSRGLPLQVAVQSQSLGALVSTLQSSDCVATVPRRLARAIEPQGSVIAHRFPGRLPRVRNVALWHERTQRSRLHHWFRSLVVDIARTVGNS